MQKVTVFTILACICFANGAFAQKEEIPAPGQRSSDDSTTMVIPDNGGFLPPTAKSMLFPRSATKTFEALNPGATRSHSNSLGTVYKMPQDNMPVLVPSAVNDKMPVVSNGSNQAFADNMPNPLAPVTPLARRRR